MLVELVPIVGKGARLLGNDQELVETYQGKIQKILAYEMREISFVTRHSVRARRG